MIVDAQPVDGEGGQEQQGVGPGRPAAAFGRPAAAFGRHDFAALWTPALLGSGIADVGHELCQFVTVDDAGAWLDAGEAGGLQWSPHMHAPTAGGHWRDRPVLTFPFTPGALAAFMLDGPGWWLAQAFGGLDRIDERGRRAPDLSMLSVRTDRSAAARRTALLLALTWDAYSAAVAAVGPRPVDPADAATTSDAEWIAAASADRAGQTSGRPWRVATQPRTVDETEWLDGMCRVLREKRNEAPDTSAGPASLSASTEDPNERRRRRLARLRELGGDMRRSGEGAWQMTVVRGALAALVREEAAAGRPMADKSDVRADLAAAMALETGDQRGT